MIPLLAAARGFLTWRTAALALSGGVILSAVFTAVVGWDVIWTRFQQEDPYAMRREMLLSSVQMIHDRPMTGYGLGTWPMAYPAYALFDDGSFANQAHNDWAQWAVEGGLPLAAAMAVFGILLGRAAWGSLWGFGLMAFLFHGFVDYPMQQRPALAGWFFAMAGALVAARTVKRIPVIGNLDRESR
jgi:O-antigen ligase